MSFKPIAGSPRSLATPVSHPHPHRISNARRLGLSKVHPYMYIYIMINQKKRKYKKAPYPIVNNCVYTGRVTPSLIAFWNNSSSRSFIVLDGATSIPFFRFASTPCVTFSSPFPTSRFRFIARKCRYSRLYFGTKDPARGASTGGPENQST